jgi:sec-independent protein translocase protein TatA
MLAEIVGPDILIVVAILLVLFGSSQLPKLARNLGQAQKELRKGFAEGQQEAEGAPSGTPPAPDEASAEPGRGSQSPPAEAPDTVTLTRAELERLVDQRVRDAKSADPTDGANERHQPG